MLGSANAATISGCHGTSTSPRYAPNASRHTGIRRGGITTAESESLPYRDFPPIYGNPTESYDEFKLRRMLRLTEQDSCADGYGHYPRCTWAVVELKSRHIRNAIEQLETTIKRLRGIGRVVNQAIIVADTFGNEIGLYRNGHQLWQKRGDQSQPVQVENLTVEAWQPGEFRHRGNLNGYQHSA